MLEKILEGKISTKVLIIGCLGYFILPTDLIPDIIAGLGYTDDAAVLGVIFKSLSSLITDDMKAQAQKKCFEWLVKE